MDPGKKCGEVRDLEIANLAYLQGRGRLEGCPKGGEGREVSGIPQQIWDQCYFR
jgi:hypothetical protein